MITSASSLQDKAKFVEVEHLEEVEKYLYDNEFMKDIINDDISWDWKYEYIVDCNDPYNKGADYTVIYYDYYRE